MIKKLIINNFAIIDYVTVEFDERFNIITGETGAGKSLIINAIDILIGGRLNEKMLRDKSRELNISGIFNLNNKTMSLSRIYKEGKSYSYIDKQKVLKKEVVEKFSPVIQFQKQHDSNNLLNVNKHLEILDLFAFNTNALLSVQKLYYNYLNDKNNYEKFLENVETNKSQHELYKYQLDELNAINLSEMEEQAINNQYKQCVNSKTVIQVLNEYIELNEDSHFSPLSKIDNFSSRIKDFIESDREIENISNRIESIILELKDIKDDISNIEKKYHFNFSELETLEQKVSQYEEIKRKYGGSIKAAKEYKLKIEQQIGTNFSFEEKIEKLESIYLNSKNCYIKAAEDLSIERNKASEKMAKKINNYLSEMDMPEARINILLEKSNIYKETGLDNCEFYCITNKGEKLKPLKEIASGGEISRIMLAINLVMQKSTNNTLVFDEVDSGISGSTASNIGELLQKLSKFKQLIIVTHLPQIASKSDVHLFAYKTKNRDRVQSLVKILDDNHHELEIARMLSGKKITNYSVKQAKEIISNG